MTLPLCYWRYRVYKPYMPRMAHSNLQYAANQQSTCFHTRVLEGLSEGRRDLCCLKDSSIIQEHMNINIHIDAACELVGRSRATAMTSSVDAVDQTVQPICLLLPYFSAMIRLYVGCNAKPPHYVAMPRHVGDHQYMRRGPRTACTA